MVTLRAQRVRKVASSGAAADRDDVLVAEEEAVAGRAPRHATAGQLGFAGDAEVCVTPTIASTTVLA